MPFEFDSSTPLSIKNLNIRRPLRPLSANRSARDNNIKRLESYLKPSTTPKPLKSILKNKHNIRFEDDKKNNEIDFLSSLKGMGSKLFQNQDPIVKKPSPPPPPPTVNKDETLKESKLEYLEKQIQILEDQNLALLRANKSNLLKKEMEKQDLEIQNQLLKREVEALKRQLRDNNSDIIGSFKSKLTNYDIDNATKVSRISSLYKEDPEREEIDDDDGMKLIRRKIELRKQRKLVNDNDLSEKISKMEQNIQILSSRLANNEPVKSSDLVLLEQIKQILNEDTSRKRSRSNDYDEDKHSKKSKLSESEQLSPIRF